MSKVVLNKVEKQYPNGFKAVHGIDLEIKDGEFMVFVGPSGCAKSTTLRMIAGLEEITGGEVYIGDKLVNDVPPKDRGIAMVFQNYALYLNSFKCFTLTMRIIYFPYSARSLPACSSSTIRLPTNQLASTCAKLMAE